MCYIPNNTRGSKKADTKGDSPYFNMTLRGKDCFLTQQPGVDIGVLEVPVAEALYELSQHPSKSVWFHAYIPAEDYASEQAIKPGAKGRKPKEFIVSINLYGAPSAMDFVGNKLSDRQLYLQEPDHREPDTEYRNPHCFPIEDAGLGQGHLSEKPSPQNFQAGLDGVLEALRDCETIVEVADSRVKTTLIR